MSRNPTIAITEKVDEEAMKTKQNSPERVNEKDDSQLDEINKKEIQVQSNM